MNSLLMDVVWGFIGGAGYAGTRLATTLWTGPEVTARARAMAIAQCLISIILAPAAAGAMTPTLTDVWTALRPTPTAFMVGLSFNAVWPLLVEKGFLRKLLSDAMRAAADRMTPGT